MNVLITAILILLISLLILEIKHKSRPKSPIKIKLKDWSTSKKPYGLNIVGSIEIKNIDKRMEVMIPEFKINPILLGNKDIKDIEFKTSISSNHQDQESRDDNYWEAYIVKSRKKTSINFSIDITNIKTESIGNAIENIWLDMIWYDYGPFGRLRRREGVNLAIMKPKKVSTENISFTDKTHARVAPIKTHILGSLDKPINVLEYYVKDIIKTGDIITMGETPLAIMQGRYIHPENINPGIVSKLCCKLFHPTSSLATACGLQSLIDIVGPSRVLVSCLIGVIGKAIGVKGLFYRIAGNQARLIDDITGTTPPYDQTLVLGPQNPQALCEELSSLLSTNIAVVDVNDLGRVKILAASKHTDLMLLHNVLLDNPAGNANQKTPIVLVRPSNKSQHNLK